MAVWRRAVADRFWFQWFELKLRWSTGAAARPHAWPFTLSRRGLLLATFASRIVDRGTKDARECYAGAAAGITTSAGYRWVEASFAVRAHGSTSAPVIWTTTASAPHITTSTTLSFY